MEFVPLVKERREPKAVCILKTELFIYLLYIYNVRVVGQMQWPKHVAVLRIRQ